MRKRPPTSCRKYLYRMASPAIRRFITVSRVCVGCCRNHPGNGEPAEMPADVQARRRAAVKVVTEATQNNPEVAAAFVGALLKANPVEQMRRELGENSPLSGLIPSQPSEPEQPYTDPSEQAEYQKLYEYNLGLTGDKARLSAGQMPNLASPVEALRTIDPAQLQALLARGFAAGQLAAGKKPAVASENLASTGRPAKKHHYLFWLVIALSAGAVLASFAIK
jgi:hypothetical protein